LVVLASKFHCSAELVYYRASDIRFATSSDNKFADNGLKAAIIKGQYTIFGLLFLTACSQIITHETVNYAGSLFTV